MELIKSPSVATAGPTLEDFRIKASDVLKANVYVAKIGNIPKFSKGNISAWIGLAKSKKTFAMTMMVSSMVSGSNLYDKFNSYAPNKVLWIDTEQSPFDVQKIVKRVKKMTGSEDNLVMYGLRPLSAKERVLKIEEALMLDSYDVLVIDGARDLIMDINNAVESSEIITKFMKWSYDYDMHVSTVLHQNHGGMKARGHIGTELVNKAETVIKVTRDEVDVNFSAIEETHGRGKGFEKFNFFIDDDGIPVVADVVITSMALEPDDAPF